MLQYIWVAMLEDGCIPAVVFWGFNGLRKASTPLLLVLRQLLVFPSHQLAVGRKKLSSRSFCAGVRAVKTFSKCFVPLISITPFPLELLTKCWWTTAGKRSHKNIYFIFLSPENNPHQMDQRADFSSSSERVLSYHPNLTTWTEAATSYVFPSQVWTFQAGWRQRFQWCVRQSFWHLFCERDFSCYQYLSHWRGTAVRRRTGHVWTEETTHISFVTWSIKKGLNNNIIHIFSLTEVRLPVDTVRVWVFPGHCIPRVWNAHNNQLCYSREVTQPAFVKEMK